MGQKTLSMRRRTPPQRRISLSEKRFNVACWGRQSGKTTFGLDKMIYKPLQGRSEGIYWYVLQTYSAAEVAFARYVQLLTPTGLILDKNKSDRVITLRNKSRIFFKSGRNYEDLRSETLDGAIIDEVRQQSPDLWSKVIRPMLSRRKGWCDFYSTPNGFDHFYDLYHFALEHTDEWSIFHAPSTEAWWWTPEEIASAKASMSEDEFAQEILAEFREIGRGKTYVNHGIHNQAERNPFTSSGLWSPYLPIIVGLDFNVRLMAWQLMQHRAGDFYGGDELALENTHTQEMAKQLVGKVIKHKPGVILIGDATGKANKTSAAGATDYSIIMQTLKDAGIEVRNQTPESNPQVKDRINMMNSRLKAADGTVHFWYHPKKCRYLKRDFERVVWKEGADGAILDQKRDPLLTHSSDGAGYPVCVYSNEWKQKPGLLRVIGR